jgi:hypothetical protein
MLPRATGGAIASVCWLVVGRARKHAKAQLREEGRQIGVGLSLSNRRR